MSDFPIGKYGIIYSDPPWRFQNWSIGEMAKRGEKWARRNGRSPYDVMDLKDICELPVVDLADKNCVLFMWATYPKLEDAFKVINSWGFKYKTVAFTWVKITRKSVAVFNIMPNGMKRFIIHGGFHFGLGYWTRQNPELCLLSTRGHPKRINNHVENLIIAPLRDHSRKPDEARTRIVELVGDLPRIELFSRGRYSGWQVWGNQIDGSVEPEQQLKLNTQQQLF